MHYANKNMYIEYAHMYAKCTYAQSKWPPNVIILLYCCSSTSATAAEGSGFSMLLWYIIYKRLLFRAELYTRDLYVSVRAYVSLTTTIVYVYAETRNYISLTCMYNRYIIRLYVWCRSFSVYLPYI